LRAAEAAERAGAIQSVPGGYEISAKAVREAVVCDAAASVLRQLHRALYELEPDAMRRAAHLEDAGARNDAANAYFEIALDALARGRFARVRVACEGMLRSASARSHFQRVARAISELVRRAGGPSENDIVHVGRACLDELFESLSPVHRLRCEGAYYTAAVAFVTDRACEAEAIAELVHRCGSAVDSAAAPSTLHWIVAKLYYGAAQFERAHEATQRGLDALRNAYDPQTEIRLRIQAAFILAARGDVTAAVESVERQIAKAIAIGLDDEAASACCAAMYMLSTLGRWDAAATWGEYALDRPETTSSLWLSVLTYNVASIELMRGRPQKALERLALLRAHPAPLRPPGRPMVLLLEGNALVQLNRYEAAATVIAEALRLDSPDWIQLELRNARAVIHELCDNFVEALENATLVMRSAGNDANAVRSRVAAAVIVARIRFRLGRTDFADPAAVCSGALETCGYARVALAEVGAYAALAARVSSANARALARATENNPDRFVRATNLFVAGRAATDANLLARAQVEFEQIGSTALLAQVRLAQTVCESSSAARSRRRLLTTREAELASFVASGKTNAEIGQLLGLSTKTVGHHLSNIIGKCGVRSRVEVAALVIRGTLPH
jgi:DNA-binding NarL/FixJ family response regulator